MLQMRSFGSIADVISLLLIGCEFDSYNTTDMCFAVGNFGRTDLCMF